MRTLCLWGLVCLCSVGEDLLEFNHPQTNIMMFWILCLLVGSVTCSPVYKEYGSQGSRSAATEPVAVPLPYSPGNWRRVNSNAGGSFPKPSGPNQSSDKVDTPISGSYSGYSSTNMAGLRKPYYSPEPSNYGVNVASYSSGYAGSAPSGGSGCGSSAGGCGAERNSGSVAAPQDETGNSGSSNAEIAALDFSDVSALEPIYSFSSRSRYQRGRAVFAQTRYIPGELAPPVMPVSRDNSKKSAQSGFAANGGF